MCLFCQMLQPCSCMHLDIKMDSSTTAFLIYFSLFLLLDFLVSCVVFYFIVVVVCWLSLL